MAGHCLACHTANAGHMAHLHFGDCVGFPGKAFFGKKSKNGVGSSQDTNGRVLAASGPAPSEEERSFVSADEFGHVIDQQKKSESRTVKELADTIDSAGKHIPSEGTKTILSLIHI